MSLSMAVQPASPEPLNCPQSSYISLLAAPPGFLLRSPRPPSHLALPREPVNLHFLSEQNKRCQWKESHPCPPNHSPLNYPCLFVSVPHQRKEYFSMCCSSCLLLGPAGQAAAPWNNFLPLGHSQPRKQPLSPILPDVASLAWYLASWSGFSICKIEIVIVLRFCICFKCFLNEHMANNSNCV